MNETSLELRHRRVKKIRTRIAAGAAALFIAVFGGLTVQLAAGHDPALSSTSSKAGVTTTTSQPQSAGSTASTSGSTTASTESTTSSQSSSGLSPVTTSQS